MDNYLHIDAVNWSSLKNLRESAMLYKYRLETPREDTAALALGRLTHALVFEPGTFARDYAVFEGPVRRGKEWEAFKAANEGKTIFKTDEVDEAAAMADAVRRHPLVQPYLRDDGKYEHVIEWTDRPTGLRCKGKVDWYIPGVLLDLKSCRTIEGRRFGADAARFGYHAQLAHYRAGLRATGLPVEKVAIVAVEKVAPYDVGVFVLDDEALYAGDEEVRGLLDRLKAHLAADQWPGRYGEEQALQLPAWMFMDEDDEELGGLGVDL